MGTVSMEGLPNLSILGRPRQPYQPTTRAAAERGWVGIAGRKLPRNALRWAGGPLKSPKESVCRLLGKPLEYGAPLVGWPGGKRGRVRESG